MNILVSGGTGLIGSALIPELEAGGHRVKRLTRKPRSGEDIRWDPDAGTIEGDLAGFDAVVHLGGESIAEGRWTPEKQRRIMESRQKGTRLLAEKVAGLPEPPSVMVSASAIGYYGDRGNELLTEESEPGTMFLSEVCREWEAAAEPAREAGVRVVHPRFGIVLSTEGGALGTTLTHLQARRRGQDRVRETVLVLGLARRRGRRHRSCHKYGCPEWSYECGCP